MSGNLLSSTFDKKWTSYALAGGAVFLAPAAKGTIITYDQTISIGTTDGEEEAFLDVDNDGTDDYRFLASSLSGEGSRFVSVEGLNGNQIWAYSDFDKEVYAQPVDAPGTVPPPDVNFLSSSAYVLSDKQKTETVKVKGSWANDIDTYQWMALQFTSGGNVYNGWAQVSAELGSASINVTQSAFDDEQVPNVSEVPEPSSFALMLLGAAGVAALKRRRSVQ